MGEDDRQRKKFERGGRIEAYTWGEVLNKPKKNRKKGKGKKKTGKKR
jgi:hypothetical protein